MSLRRRSNAEALDVGPDATPTAVSIGLVGSTAIGDATARELGSIGSTRGATAGGAGICLIRTFSRLVASASDVRPVLRGCRHCHTAPPSSTTPSSINEQKRALGPFARFHIGKILCADEVSQRSCQRKEQRLGCLPAALRAPGTARVSSFLLSVVMEPLWNARSSRENDHRRGRRWSTIRVQSARPYLRHHPPQFRDIGLCFLT